MAEAGGYADFNYAESFEMEIESDFQTGEFSMQVEDCPRAMILVSDHHGLGIDLEDWDTDLRAKGFLSKEEFLKKRFDEYNVSTQNKFNNFKGWRKGSIVIRHVNRQQLVIQFGRECFAADVRMILSTIQYFCQNEMTNRTSVHINGGTHGGRDGSNSWSRSLYLKEYTEGAHMFDKHDYKAIKNTEVRTSWHEVSRYFPPLYNDARIVINAWCFSDFGYYGGSHISWGLGMPEGNDVVQSPDDDTTRMRTKSGHCQQCDPRRKFPKMPVFMCECCGKTLCQQLCQCPDCDLCAPNGQMCTRFCCKSESSKPRSPEAGNSSQTTKPSFPAFASIRTFQGHTNLVYCVCVNSTSTYLFSCSQDKSVKMWSISSGECLNTFQDHSKAVNYCAIDDKDRFLFTASNDTTAKMYNIETGSLVRTFNGYSELTSCQFLEGCLFTASYDKTITMWKAQSGDLMHTLQGHGDRCWGIGLSKNYLYSTSSDGTLKMWQLRNGRCLKTFKGHNNKVYACCVFSNEKYLVSASNDKTLKIWNTATERCERTLQGHQKAVNDCCLSADDRFLFSASSDKTVKMWDLQSGECVHTFQEHTGAVKGVCISLKGDFIFSCSSDNVIKMWSTGLA